MPQPTPTELLLLRQRPHYTNLHLAIFKPQTVLACRINDANLDPGDRVVNFDTVSAGSYSNVQSGMTMYIGSTPGGRDLGRIRVRSCAPAAITVAENSITWINGAYLTVVKYWEPWPIYTRTVGNGANLPLLYKDYDIPYVDQNNASGMGALICMGPHHAQYLENGAAQIYYTATGTVSPSNMALSFNWAFEGGTPGSGSTMAPGWVTYNTPGDYTTELIVSTASGTSDVSYRHVMIKDRYLLEPSVQKWGMDDLVGSLKEGGYSVNLWMREDVADVVDGALVVIFADDAYGTTKQSIGGSSQNRGSIFFVGYIMNGSIQYDYRTSIVKFQAASISAVMKQEENFPIYLESHITASRWDEMQDLSVLRAIYHFFRWNTTVNLCTDIQYNGPDYVFKYFDNAASSLYDAIDKFMKTSLVGSITADRQDKLILEIGPNAYLDPTGTFPVNMELGKQDWKDEPDISESILPETAFLEYGGASYDGPSTGTNLFFMSMAPGVAPLYQGKRESALQGLILMSQDHCNNLVGAGLGYKNCRYPNVSINLAGNYRNFDITPVEQVLLSITASQTFRGLAWDKHPFHVDGVKWKYDPINKVLLPILSLHELVHSYPGVTEPIPIPNQPNIPGEPNPTGTHYKWWPLWPPGWPPPPIVPYWPPPPDTSSGTCYNTLNYPANGPFQAWQPGLIPEGDTDLFCPSFIRSGAALNKTLMAITGHFQISTNDGAVWTDTADNSFWGVSAYTWNSYGPNVNATVQPSTDNGHGTRTAIFAPPAGLCEAGYTIHVTEGLTYPDTGVVIAPCCTTPMWIEFNGGRGFNQVQQQVNDSDSWKPGISAHWSIVLPAGIAGNQIRILLLQIPNYWNPIGVLEQVQMGGNENVSKYPSLFVSPPFQGNEIPGDTSRSAHFTQTPNQQSYVDTIQSPFTLAAGTYYFGLSAFQKYGPVPPNDTNTLAGHHPGSYQILAIEYNDYSKWTPLWRNTQYRIVAESVDLYNICGPC